MKRNLLKKASAAVLAAALCLSLASCGDTSYIAQAEGETIPAGIYILAQYYALGEAQSTEGYDSTLEDIWDNQLDGKPLETWVNDRAVELLQRYVEVEKEFVDQGLELDQDTLDSIATQVENYWASGEELYENIGVSQDSYELYLTNNQKYYELFDAYYGEGGTEEIPDEDLMAHYEGNYAEFKMISFSKTDSSGETLDDEAMAELEDTANSYLQRAQDGEDFDALIAERADEVAEANGTDSTDTSDEEDSSEEVNNMMMIRKDEASYVVSTSVANAIFDEAQIGAPILLSDDYGYYVVLRYDVTEDEETYAQMRQTVLLDLKQEDYDAVLLENAQSLDLVLNESAVNRYSPKKIVKEEQKFANA